MTKFIVGYTEEIWYRLAIEADTLEQAKENFWQGKYDLAEAKEIGSEISSDVFFGLSGEEVSA